MSRSSFGKDIIRMVDARLDGIERAFPKKELAQLQNRMRLFFDNVPSQDSRVPYAFWGGDPAEKPDLPPETNSWDAELVTQLQYILEHAAWGDWFYPALSPGTVQAVIPSCFGCVEERASRSVKVKPVINVPSDVHSLPSVGFGPETAGGQMLAKMRRWRDLTCGRIPFYEPDMQGPFSVASQIWDVEKFLLALYDSPDEVKFLLERCSAAVALFAREARDVAGDDMIPFHCMPTLWMPPEKSLAVSEDLVAVVSPAIIEEFVRPCLEFLTSEFGGCFVHSCGSVNHVAEALAAVPGLIGMNFSSVETDLPDIARRLGRKKILVVHNSPVNRTDLPLLQPAEHAALCAKVFREHKINGFCIVIPCFGQMKPSDHATELEKIFL